MYSQSDRPTKYFLPYVVIFAATWALTAMARIHRPVELIIAAVLQLFVGAMVWAWRPERPSTPRFVIGTVALVASVGLMRDASGQNPGVAVLVLLPIVFAAVRSRRGELIFAVADSALMLYVPAIFIRGSQYPLSSLTGDTLTLLVGIAIGSTVLFLVSRLDAGQVRQREMTEDARGQLVTEDALRQVATLVAAGAPPAELFSEVSLQLARVAGASMGAVVRYDHELGIGEMVGGWRFDRVILSGRKYDLSRGTATAVVYRTGKPVTLPSYPEGESVDSATGAVGAPIFVRGQLWGSATVAFTAKEEIPADIQMRFERFAELVAMAISNADNVSQLVEHATTDALTGIPNRRAFEEELRRELDHASRHGRPLAVALLDVDHFKAVNDSYGHQAGDEVLSAVAELLGAQTRSGELVARFGGEEFVWLMPDTTAEEAVVAAERARQRLAELKFEHVGHLTLSAGINSNLAAASAAELLAGADAAMYEAKRRGRDQTVAAPASISSAEVRVKPAAA
jgi:diguanylate cyclase (GGDEF)-like protein